MTLTLRLQYLGWGAKAVDNLRHFIALQVP